MYVLGHITGLGVFVKTTSCSEHGGGVLGGRAWRWQDRISSAMLAHVIAGALWKGVAWSPAEGRCVCVCACMLAYVLSLLGADAATGSTTQTMSAGCLASVLGPGPQATAVDISLAS